MLKKLLDYSAFMDYIYTNYPGVKDSVHITRMYTRQGRGLFCCLIS